MVNLFEAIIHIIKLGTVPMIIKIFMIVFENIQKNLNLTTITRATITAAITVRVTTITRIFNNSFHAHLITDLSSKCYYLIFNQYMLFQWLIRLKEL